MRRACVLADTTISADVLPENMRQQAQAIQAKRADSVKLQQASKLSLGDLSLYTLEELEFTAIQQALENSGGDRGRAARALGIDRTTLYRKLKKYIADGRISE